MAAKCDASLFELRRKQKYLGRFGGKQTHAVRKEQMNLRVV